MSKRRKMMLAGVTFLLAVTACGAEEGASDDAAPATSVVGASETSTPLAAVDTEAIAVANAFMAARAQLDSEAMIEALSPDASILDFGFWERSPEEYRGLTKWWTIFGWELAPEGCVASPSGPAASVHCVHTESNAWSVAQGIEPVAGAYDLRIEDGLVVEVVKDTPDWSPVVGRWFDWLEEFHLGNVALLYRIDDDGRLTGGPSTEPEALERFQQLLPEYLEWEQNASGT